MKVERLLSSAFVNMYVVLNAVGIEYIFYYNLFIAQILG